MIIAITVAVIIIILLLLIILNNNNNNNNNNGNFSKNQVIWLKKCFLRLCLKVFKLSVFFNVPGIWLQNEGPIKYKAFWSVFVFQKGRLSFKKLFLKLILPLGVSSKTSFKYYRQLPLINLNTIEITHCSNLLLTGNQFKSLNSLWGIVDILSNWRQKRIHLFYITWIPLYIILRFPAFFNLSFEPKIMHFIFLSPRWILNLLPTNHSHKLVKSLFNWCSIAWTSLCWNVRLESFAYKNKLELTASGISLA